MTYHSPLCMAPTPNCFDSRKREIYVRRRMSGGVREDESDLRSRECPARCSGRCVPCGGVCTNQADPEQDRRGSEEGSRIEPEAMGSAKTTAVRTPTHATAASRMFRKTRACGKSGAIAASRKAIRTHESAQTSVTFPPRGLQNCPLPSHRMRHGLTSLRCGFLFEVGRYASRGRTAHGTPDPTTAPGIHPHFNGLLVGRVLATHPIVSGVLP